MANDKKGKDIHFGKIQVPLHGFIITIFLFTLIATLGLHSFEIEPQGSDASQRKKLKPSVKPTAAACIPRPACLDIEPYCLIPEPADGWCPTPTATPSPKTTPLRTLD